MEDAAFGSDKEGRLQAVSTAAQSTTAFRTALSLPQGGLFSMSPQPGTVSSPIILTIPSCIPLPPLTRSQPRVSAAAADLIIRSRQFHARSYKTMNYAFLFLGLVLSGGEQKHLIGGITLQKEKDGVYVHPHIIPIHIFQ